MKPESIAVLEQNRDNEFKLESLRVSKPKDQEVECRLLEWIEIARARFAVRIAIGHLTCIFSSIIVMVKLQPYVPLIDVCQVQIKLCE